MNGFWADVVVHPLLDLLIALYNTVAFGNLGVAVIELTVMLRLALLPLTILAERSTARYERLSEDVAVIQAQFKNDPVLANEQVRELLKSRRVSPWAKAIVLFIQLAVLIALYQVFVRGINASLDSLAAWVGPVALPIDATFFGFELGSRNLWWALAVGVFLFLEISYEQRKYAHLLGKQDAIYRYAFPLFTVALLTALPMVKSLFVLTSMGFSLAVSGLRHALWPVPAADKKA